MIYDLRFVRTVAECTNSHIAIMAQYAKAVWKILSFEPSIKLGSATKIELPSMLYPATPYMVNTQKLRLLFTATRAFVSVVDKNFSLNYLFAPTIASIQRFLVFLVVDTFIVKSFFFMRFLPNAIGCKTLLLMAIIISLAGILLGLSIHFSNIVSCTLSFVKSTWDGQTIFPKKRG